MSRAEQLQALLERVKAATNASRDLDHAVLLALGYRADIECWRWRDPTGELWTHADNPSGSLDAALALVERVLPGWSYEFRRSGFGTPSQCLLWNPMHAVGEVEYRASLDNGTPPLAILAALLSALIAQEPCP